MPYRSTDAIFRDMVDNNEDYYYMFRQVNEGLVSNPTAVFKARLVVDADDAKVMLDTHEFPKKILSQPRASFKSMMQIKPAVEQILFLEEQEALSDNITLKGKLDDLKLGIQKEAVWGRKLNFVFDRRPQVR